MKPKLTDNQLEMLRRINEWGMKKYGGCGWYTYVKFNNYASTATANQLHKKCMIEIDNNGDVTITDLGKQQLL